MSIVILHAAQDREAAAELSARLRDLGIEAKPSTEAGDAFEIVALMRPAFAADSSLMAALDAAMRAGHPILLYIPLHLIAAVAELTPPDPWSRYPRGHSPAEIAELLRQLDPETDPEKLRAWIAALREGLGGFGDPAADATLLPSDPDALRRLAHYLQVRVRSFGTSGGYEDEYEEEANDEDEPPAPTPPPLAEKAPATAAPAPALGHLYGADIAPVAMGKTRSAPKPGGEVSGLFTPAPPERASVSAFAPRAVRPGARFLVQAFLHTPMQADAVKRMAAERDPKARRRGIAGLSAPIALEDRIRVTLEARGLKVRHRVHDFSWSGETLEAGFEVEAPLWRRPDDYTLILRAAVNGAPAARLAFQVSVDRAAPRAAEPVDLAPAAAYRYVFFSYSSDDRPAVLARAQMLERLGIPFFQDVVSLRAGDRWEPALSEHMGKADLVLLFWSKAAAKSEWVRREIEWALDLQSRSPEALPEIVPVILDGPPPAKPPASLKAIHFNDPVRCIQAAYERA